MPYFTFVGWVEGRETQRSIANVGFRPSTQPTNTRTVRSQRTLHLHLGIKYSQLIVI